MGREIREVPADWAHPEYPAGHKYRGHIPLHSYSYEQAVADSKADGEKWEYQPDEHAPTHYAGRPLTHIQMYENVTEGTPVSPVFESREALADWLVTQGRSRSAADAFVRSGYAPSFVIAGGVMASGVDAYDVLPNRVAVDGRPE